MDGVFAKVRQHFLLRHCYFVFNLVNHFPLRFIYFIESHFICIITNEVNVADLSLQIIFADRQCLDLSCLLITGVD